MLSLIESIPLFARESARLFFPVMDIKSSIVKWGPFHSMNFLYRVSLSMRSLFKFT